MQLSAILQMDYNYTQRQGQFLTFIYYYTKLNSESPSELDITRYFKITAPSAHRMVVALEECKGRSKIAVGGGAEKNCGTSK